MFKKPSNNNELDLVIEKVGNYWNINNRPITQTELNRLVNEVRVFKTTLLYQILLNTQVKDIEKSIIQDAKTLDDLYFYRAMLADRFAILELLETIVSDGANTNLVQSIKL